MEQVSRIWFTPRQRAELGERWAAPILPERDRPLKLLPGPLNKIALRLNQRPAKTLGFESPGDRLNAMLQ